MRSKVVRKKKAYIRGSTINLVVQIHVGKWEEGLEWTYYIVTIWWRVDLNIILTSVFVENVKIEYKYNIEQKTKGIRNVCQKR